MKGMVTALLAELGIERVAFVPEDSYGIYHPGRCARIVIPSQEEEQKIVQMPAAEGGKEGDPDELSKDFDMIKSLLGVMSDVSKSGSVELGIMGEVHPDVAAAYGMDIRCYTCELMFDVVARMA